MDHGARSHSRFGASIAHRWFYCPGSVRLEANAPPETPSASALKGTAAHELLEALLRVRLDPDAARVLREAADPDLLRGVSRCIDHVETLLDSHPEALIYTEVRFKLPSSVVGGEAFGTCDIAIWIPKLHQLHIIDYKNGVEIVDEVNNLQCRYYMAGAWFTIPGLAANVTDIAITIVQPNAFAAGGPVRTWWTTPDNVIDFMEEFDEAATRALDPDAVLRPELKVCQYCKAFTICPAAKAKGLDAAIRNATDIRLVNETGLPNPEVMKLDELAYTLGAAPFLRKFLDRCEEVAYAMAMKGHPIPGQKLVAKLTRRKYDGDEPEVAEKLMLLYDVELDEIMPRSLLGLTAMEDVIRNKVREAAPKGKKKQAVEQAMESFAFVTVKEPATGLTLVPMGDRRPAVNPLAVTYTEGINLPAVTVSKP